ncbi:hypothetical protein AMATHDRAFT_147746 [Amanita thiersii Skay4041]|uniref:Cytochrome P450 n=1 Tax=Amanita thiersii Skay4041 TaxID=703135 RepID=A0A2A9NNT6_9AGAR|nr:hypothetical protein AMATHDRAFT_147746 [Amanita thiersii Skay4041]
MIISPAIQLAIVIAILGICIRLYSISAPRQHLPPGPPSKIFSGNVHQIPKSEYWRTYQQWSQLYGPIIFFRTFSRRFVVLNTFKSAADLLDSRSSLYSDRPPAWMQSELVGRKFTVFNISSQHPRFKIYRKLLHKGLSARAIQDYRSLIQDQSQKLLRSLADAKGYFVPYLRQNAGAIILRLAYGWTVNEAHDPFVALVEEAFALHNVITKPGRWLVDAFPLLRFVPAWFPGAGFRRKAREYNLLMTHYDTAPFTWAKDAISSKNYAPSFASYHLCPEDGHVLDEEEQDIVKWCCSALYSGGADTTVAAMTAFFAAMVMHPDVQRKARCEIEEVIGKEQPRADDEERLPYVSAVIKETLRWAPPVPLGLPHSVIEEDHYMGYHIPKGTTVIANIWAIAHDENIYPDAYSFKPERYLRIDNHEPELDPRKFVFGFGRRVCPGGALFAELSIFLNIVNILNTFVLRKATDSDGKEITPPLEYTTSVTSHIKPFPCQIIPIAQTDILN